LFAQQKDHISLLNTQAHWMLVGVVL